MSSAVCSGPGSPRPHREEAPSREGGRGGGGEGKLWPREEGLRWPGWLWFLIWSRGTTTGGASPPSRCTRAGCSQPPSPPPSPRPLRGRFPPEAFSGALPNPSELSLACVCFPSLYSGLLLIVWLFDPKEPSDSGLYIAKIWGLNACTLSHVSGTRLFFMVLLR